MTDKEAKTLFEEDLKNGKCDEKCPECNARELAVKALEKRIPRRAVPRIVKTDCVSIGRANWCKGTTVYECPNCSTFISPTYDFCYKCGQAVDWKKEAATSSVNKHITGADACVMCGEIIPEGTQVCPLCKQTVGQHKTNYNHQKAENDCAKVKIEICAEVIDRQNKEIERLKGWEDVLKAEKHSLIKYTAYKEFAEKLRKKAIHSQYIGDVIPVSVVDHILKEMVGKK